MSEVDGEGQAKLRVLATFEEAKHLCMSTGPRYDKLNFQRIET